MSVQAETAVLGACLLSSKAVVETLDTLTADMFQRDAHRTVFETVKALADASDPVDTISVTRRLSTAGKLDHVGGPVALHDLADQAPAGMNVGYWCHLVADTARRLRIGRTLDRARATLLETDDVDELVDELVADVTSTEGRSAIVDAGSLTAAFEKRVTTGSPQAGLTGPWMQTDFFRFPDDGLTIVTGLPGSGKSTWLDCYLAGWLDKAEGNVAFFSPEMAPADNHLYHLSWTVMGADPRRYTDVAKATAEDLMGRCWWIDDDRDSTPSGVLATARKLVRRNGVKVLVIDPYNNLEPDRASRGDRQDLYIQALLRRLRRFARNEGVAVIVVAHPRRTEKLPGTDDVYRVPSAGDISGGQEWWNAADLIVTVWRNQSGERAHDLGRPEDVTVRVSKCRFSKWGRTGSGKLTFVESERRYR